MTAKASWDLAAIALGQDHRLHSYRCCLGEAHLRPGDAPDLAGEADFADHSAVA